MKILGTPLVYSLPLSKDSNETASVCAFYFGSTLGKSTKSFRSFKHFLLRSAHTGREIEPKKRGKHERKKGKAQTEAIWESLRSYYEEHPLLKSNAPPAKDMLEQYIDKCPATELKCKKTKFYQVFQEFLNAQ